jgi:type IV pilus assembly protein PilE
MRRQRGFNLVELMIVVVILAILAAIAWPSYQNQVRRGNRAAAQALMSDISNKEALYLSQARAYGTLAEVNVTVPTDVSKVYDVTVVPSAGPPPGFVITATPKGNQVPDGTLTLDNNGTKTPPEKW